MIRVERSEDGIGAGLKGSVGELVLEFSVGLGHFISRIDDKDKKIEALAEIIVTAIDIAHTESGQDATTVSVDGEALDRIRDILAEMKGDENDGI